MTEWPLVRLGDIAAAEKSAISKPYGSAMLRDDYRDAGVPVVRGVNLARGRFYDDEFVFISEELAESMPGARLQPGDLVFTHRGSVGQISMIPRAPRYHRYTLSTSQVKARLDPARAIPEFFYYWFLSPGGRHSILQNISTVGVPGLARPVETIKSLLVPLPPLDEQRRIAGVLGALDDLIDNNRVLAHGAQSLATALASSSPGQVALTDLASVADVRQFRPAGAVDHFSIPAFDERELPERIEGEAIKSAKLLLAGPTVLVSRLNPQTPRVWMAYPNDVPAVASTEFVPMVSAGSVAVEEVWAVCAGDQFAAQMMARVTGTTGSHQRVDKAAIPQLLVADVRKLDRPERVAIASLVREAHASLVSASEAAYVRDELLPLLLSGRVRVEDVAA